MMRDATPAERWRNRERAERRRWRQRVVIRPFSADPYTYGMTPAEKRRVNREAMAALVAMGDRWPEAER
jgi:hypothetical protein